MKAFWREYIAWMTLPKILACTALYFIASFGSFVVLDHGHEPWGVLTAATAFGGILGLVCLIVSVVSLVSRKARARLLRW